MSTKIDVHNPVLFRKALTGISNEVNELKLSIDDTGITVFAKNGHARMKIKTNAITSTEPVEFCLDGLNKFIKTLKITEGKLAENEKIKMTVTEAFITLSTKTFKSKTALVKEDIIQFALDKEINVHMEESCRLRTTAENIKELNNASFIFSDNSLGRVYIYSDPDRPGKLKVNLGNKTNEFSNTMTFEFGQILAGKFDREITMDLNRINTFIMFDEIDEIDIVIPQMAVLTSAQKIEDGDEYIHIWIVSSIMK